MNGTGADWRPAEQDAGRKARARGALGRGGWLRVGAFSALLLTVCLSGPALPQAESNVSADRLREIEESLSESRKRLKARRAEARRLGKELEEIRERSVEAAFEVQKREARLTRTEARLKDLLEEEAVVIGRLKERQRALVSVLSALQAMERNKPPALLVQPDDAVNAARSAMLLGSVVPDIQAQADALGRELDALSKVRVDIEGERDALRETQGELVDEQKQLSDLIARKQRLQETSELKAQEEAERIAELASQARDLRSLVEALELRGASIKPVMRPGSTATEDGTGLRDRPNRPGEPLPPVSVPLADVKGRLRAPVAGRIVRRFGSEDASGTPIQGLVFATRPGAQIVAPFDSRIAFAQPFRNYGQVLILATGDGYHFVLTGLAQVYGVVGQELLAGEPVGAMGKTADAQTFREATAPSRTMAATLAGASSGGGAGLAPSAQGPTLYFELRHNGEPVDPLPWLSGWTRKVGG